MIIIFLERKDIITRVVDGDYHVVSTIASGRSLQDHHID